MADIRSQWNSYDLACDLVSGLVDDLANELVDNLVDDLMGDLVDYSHVAHKSLFLAGGFPSLSYCCCDNHEHSCVLPGIPGHSAGKMAGTRTFSSWGHSQKHLQG